ncbi:hypothetical protein [Peribacillus loiseleuriae]|uniref:Uncharacterized protein n=1 Tax=Peribacillus loiseleuriae TaxID=1679170 RepID=A0A0K9GTP9_9BACI|nr:hypothetical protein [Peribacillus loiseleuriae]KMY49652.1 hypothetical protein AC625_08955 [Peribacillus loiseleuriae]
MVFYIIISWLLVGFIAGIMKINDKDFKEIHQGAIDKTGLNHLPNPKLFAWATSTLFGYYSIYVEVKYQTCKKS